MSIGSFWANSCSQIYFSFSVLQRKTINNLAKNSRQVCRNSYFRVHRIVLGKMMFWKKINVFLFLGHGTKSYRVFCRKVFSKVVKSGLNVPSAIVLGFFSVRKFFFVRFLMRLIKNCSAFRQKIFGRIAEIAFSVPIGLFSGNFFFFRKRFSNHFCNC